MGVGGIVVLAAVTLAALSAGGVVLTERKGRRAASGAGRVVVKAPSAAAQAPRPMSKPAGALGGAASPGGASVKWHPVGKPVAVAVVPPTPAAVRK